MLEREASGGLPRCVITGCHSMVAPIVVAMMAIVADLRHNIDTGAATRAAPNVVARSGVAMPPVGPALARPMVPVHLLYLRSNLNRGHRRR
jgi:hypothetical protein